MKRSWKLDHATKSEIVRLYGKTTMSVSAIAARFDISEATVARVSHLRGVRRRKQRSDAGKSHKWECRA